MGKLISWIALIFLLAVVPFGSWYYLKSGLDYRKNAISELAVKDSFPSILDSAHLLLKRTTVLTIGTDTVVDLVSSSLLKQFEKTPGFQVLDIETLSQSNAVGTSDFPELQSFIDKYRKASFLLIDTSLQIRNSYTKEEKDVRKLIEHIAIILPRQKETDIQFKK